MLEQVDFNNTNFYNGMQVFHIDVFYCSHAHKAIYFIYCNKQNDAYQLSIPL